MSVVRRVAIAIALSAPVACLFPPLATLSSDGGTTTDAGKDSGTEASPIDASDGGLDVLDANNVIWSDDFEQGCAGWTPQYGSVASTTTAHSGTNACLVCNTSSGPYFTFDHGTTPFAPIEAGVSYTGRVWVRVAPQTSTPNLVCADVLRTVDSMGSYVQQAPYTELPVTQAWTQLSSTMLVDAGIAMSGYIALNHYNLGDCFIVDDFTLATGP
jgi:hypothetical protein